LKHGPVNMPLTYVFKLVRLGLKWIELSLWFDL
jgi:hypothetical protein